MYTKSKDDNIFDSLYKSTQKNKRTKKTNNSRSPNEKSSSKSPTKKYKKSNNVTISTKELNNMIRRLKNSEHLKIKRFYEDDQYQFELKLLKILSVLGVAGLAWRYGGTLYTLGFSKISSVTSLSELASLPIEALKSIKLIPGIIWNDLLQDASNLIDYIWNMFPSLYDILWFFLKWLFRTATYIVFTMFKLVIKIITGIDMDLYQTFDFFNIPTEPPVQPQG